MARFHQWLWRFALLAGGVTALFFALMAVVPLATVGEPVLDSVILRARYWADYGFGMVQLSGGALWLLVAFTAKQWAQRMKAIAAAMILFGCVMAMMAEYGSLIEFGDLRDAIAVARHKLMISRGITLGLAVTSLALGWSARPLRHS